MSTVEEKRFEVAKGVLVALMTQHRTPIDAQKGGGNGSNPTGERRTVLFPDTAARLSVEYADELLKALNATP